MQPCGQRVLVVDDEPYVRKVIQRLLGRAGYATETAEGVEQALQRLREVSFDVLLLDLYLADGPVDRLLNTLTPGGARPAVVLMSGSFQAHEEPSTRHGAVVALLAKPFSSEALRTTVLRALASREAPEEEATQEAHSRSIPVARRTAEQLRSSPLDT